MTLPANKLLSIFILLISVLSFGCSDRNPKSSYKYLIPFLQADGSYKWQEVELTTLYSPFRLEGSTASIHYKPANGNKQDWGPVAEPKLARAGSVWVPQDAPSAVALATYATMEALRKWETAIYPDTDKVYPRKLILEVAVKSSGEEVTDNAFYVPAWDVVLVVPYKEGGIPLAVNQGVIAHEHFHVQFWHHMMGPMIQKAEQEVGDRELKKDEETQLKENLLLLRALNEGLADFYGYAFTGQARFINPSEIMSAESAKVRALDFDFIGLDRSFMTLRQNMMINGAGDTCMSGSPYCLGTQVARLLYQMAEGRPSKAVPLIRQLYQSFSDKKWQSNLASKLLKTNVQSTEFLSWTFADSKEKLDANQCALLQKATQGDLKSIPSCSGGLP